MQTMQKNNNCPHRELAYFHVNAAKLACKSYINVCMYCLHAKLAGRLPFMLMLSEFPADIPLSTDPRLDTERRISAAMLHYPIIITTRGHIVDGRHRIVKARRHNYRTISTITATDEELISCTC